MPAPTPLDLFHPVVKSWFHRKLGQPTAAQAKAWPAIAAGKNVLLLAPTGSGKTLAAFLGAIDRIAFRSASVDPRPRVRTLYVSPLKALGADVEKNLQAPLAGVSELAASQGLAFRAPTVGVRSGDTLPSERAAMLRQPPDILITTPESLYLLLTSRGRTILSQVETVIVDEIHTLVGTKRGAHLFLSLERLEAERRLVDSRVAPLQRVGLSATQRPLEEVARLLGGGDAPAEVDRPVVPRAVEIIDAGRTKRLELSIEVPVDDMADLANRRRPDKSEGAKDDEGTRSIWTAIHPRLVELIRAHRGTMVFVNSRRLAERMSAALNDLAGHEIAAAHHGSLAKETRLAIEQRLKQGELPAIVATSSLELGLDLGSIDLAIQIEAPPSIASGIQRIGRAGHQVGAPSKGVVFPKFRGDLLACGAAIERMTAGEVEETFYPRNTLDVLAQQIVAIVSMRAIGVDELHRLVRGAANFAELTRGALESVLDLLSGRYPSDEFSELRPRITWDRESGRLTSRVGSQRLAILNGGTIADRGLYGVFLVGEETIGGAGRRVGELDEEMVFETAIGDVFRLGASTWRVIDITRDRVLVSPAPGEVGRLPFWRGDGPGRPLEFGRAIGRLARELVAMEPQAAEERLRTRHALDERAARNLVAYLQAQREATEDVPSDQTIVVESFVDDVGDWRVCLLSPFGSRVHAPWATVVAARLRDVVAGEVDVAWGDEGIALRLPRSERLPPLETFFPDSQEIENEVAQRLGATAMFAARFRENAARALLLPRRAPGRRTPLWAQRRRAADLLRVASRHPTFPILLETYRECLRDVFDLKGLREILAGVERRSIRARLVESAKPSPFAAALLFDYVGQFLYEGDAPLAERQAAALALDSTRLRELLGEAALRDSLDASAIARWEREAQRLDPERAATSADAVHAMLLSLGDLNADEIAARTNGANAEIWLDELASAKRIAAVRIAGEKRWIAVEDSARLRDALGAKLPKGIPKALLEPVADPLGDLVARYARTHRPFHAEDVAMRLGLGVAPALTALQALARQGRVVEGEFLPGGRGREWCDAEVLKTLMRRSLDAARKRVAPVPVAALARFATRWQGLDRPRRGLEGLLDAIERLQGCELPASDLETAILPARVADYKPADLDALCAAGEVVWRGAGELQAGDGRIALYLTDSLATLAPPPQVVEGELHGKIRERLAARGALFFDELERSIGGFRNDLLTALWEMVWSGEVTNDTLAPLRAKRSSETANKAKGRRTARFRSRRTAMTPGAQGRWSLLWPQDLPAASPTDRAAALVRTLLDRHGVLTRALVAAETQGAGFGPLYPVLKAMEDAGKARRGYFVAGLGASQFALPGAVDALRRANEPRAEPTTVVLSACDPANPYGASIPWPANENDKTSRPGRGAGARVVLVDGELAAHWSRNRQSLLTFLPSETRDRQPIAQQLATALATATTESGAILLTKIDGRPASESPLTPCLTVVGFVATSRGLLRRRGV